jgi:hypothetical protein
MTATRRDANHHFVIHGAIRNEDGETSAHDRSSRMRVRYLVSGRAWLFLIFSLLLGSVATVRARPAEAATLRNFDAVTTVAEARNIWKHMAIIDDQYVIYNDAGLIQGPALIRNKWPFLPERFMSGIDSAAVHFSGPGYRWRYTWTNGTEAAIFEDSGLVRIQNLPSRYDALSAQNLPSGAVRYQSTLGALEGLSSPIERTADFLVPKRPINFSGRLPERFSSDLDDVSRELVDNAGAEKISYYKGNERLITDQGQNPIELVSLDAKWPFLTAWRSR